MKKNKVPLSISDEPHLLLVYAGLRINDDSAQIRIIEDKDTGHEYFQLRLNNKDLSIMISNMELKQIVKKLEYAIGGNYDSWTIREITK